MTRRINRDADGIVRNKIPTIRQFDTDARFKGGRSTALYYDITSATTTSFGKKWADNMRSMTIANNSSSVDMLVDVQIFTAESTVRNIVKSCKVRVGTSLVLTEDDLSIGSNEYIRIITAATATGGTPLAHVTIRF